MASKGILVSDPSLHFMTPSRWAFEFAAIVSDREQSARTSIELIKQSFIHFLGLDLVPPREAEDGHLSPSPVKYLPLTAFMNPKFFQSTIEKRAKLEEQEKALGNHASTTETMGYDEMLENIDSLIPVFEELFEGADNKVYEEQLKSAVKAGVFSDSSDPPPTSPTPAKPKKVKLSIEND